MVYHPEAGFPVDARHFAPEEYGAFMQNWAVVQDGRGLIYVANNYGILEYDGESWRLIRTRTSTIVRALARDSAGTVYVGMQGDFGYLKSNAAGELQYVSLIEHLDPEAADFKDIWSVHVTSSGVYFQARQWLFRWDGREMKKWKAEGAFHTSFVVRGQFYMREHGRGLLTVLGDSLQFIDRGEYFRDLSVYALMPMSEGRMLIGTRKKGFLIYDHGEITPLITDADQLLEQHDLYGGTVLPDGSFALATLGAGIIVIDEAGRLLRVYNTASGLADNWVNAVYVDDQGGLWAALNAGGIMRMQVMPAISVLDDRLGIEGFVFQVVRHDGVLYVYTSAGLFSLQTQKDASAWDVKRPYFEYLGSVDMVRSFLSVGGSLVLGTDKGIYTLRGDEFDLISESAAVNVFHLVRSSIFPNRIYAGTKEGLAFLQHTTAGWKELEKVPGVDAEIRGIAEDDDGSLWLGTMDGGVLHVRLASQPTGMPEIQSFSHADGLPGEVVMPYRTTAGIRFVSRLGVYTMSPHSKSTGESKLFNLDSKIHSTSSAQPDTIHASEIDKHGNLWLRYSDRIEAITFNADGTTKITAPDALRFRTGSYFEIYPEEDGVVWVSDGGALFRYDAHVPSIPHTPFSAFVRRVKPVDADSTIFGGTFSNDSGHPSLSQSRSFLPILEFESSDLEFEFAAPSLNYSNQTEYRYYLEGRDSGWGGWSTKTTATYTNFREGTYTFRVQARNAQGYVSSVGSYTFKVLPPWYRTWWAYTVYAGMAVAVCVLALHYRNTIIENRKAREQAIQLARERIANERLQQANARLQEANDRLNEADRIKDEFLTNTSHELRTPITAILGFTSVLKEELPEQYHEFLEIIDENGHRLLHTVNSLLDIAKLKAGAVSLNREVVNVASQCSAVIRFLSPLAERKGLWLELVQPEQPVYARLDSPSFDRILQNLIGNAIKFTEEGGVTVRIDTEEKRVRVQVIDTGIGIDEEFLPHLFQEFRQASTGLSRSYEGSGLGLAISARLVNLMEGTIHVESYKGRGSTFTISFQQVVGEEQRVEHVRLS